MEKIIVKWPAKRPPYCKLLIRYVVQNLDTHFVSSARSSYIHNAPLKVQQQSNFSPHPHHNIQHLLKITTTWSMQLRATVGNSRNACNSHKKPTNKTMRKQSICHAARKIDNIYVQKSPLQMYIGRSTLCTLWGHLYIHTEHTLHTDSTLTAHSEHALSTLREHSEKTQGTLREHSEITWEHWGSTQKALTHLTCGAYLCSQDAILSGFKSSINTTISIS